MKKISIAAVKRFFASNIGREIEAEWPEITVAGNCGTSVMKHPRSKRTVHSVKSNEVCFTTEKGLSHLTFGKGDYAYMGNGVIELWCGLDNKLAVRYIIPSIVEPQIV